MQSTLYAVFKSVNSGC